MIPVYEDDESREERVRKLIAMEIERIVEDLEIRHEYLVELWSRHRDRGPFIDTLFTRWRTLSFQDLALMSSATVAAVELFYRELDEFKLYVGFTQDMPTTLSERYLWMVDRLRAYGNQAIAALGGAPPRPLIEFEDAEETPEPLVGADGLPISRLMAPPEPE